ncbi:hypothetical protein BH23PLA1_BH23PLA1_34800 [soil metagenome]
MEQMLDVGKVPATQKTTLPNPAYGKNPISTKKDD